MMMSKFKNEIEQYLIRASVSPSRFGRQTVNDPGFVYRLRKGGECRPSTIEKVRSYMVAEATGRESEDAA